MSLKESGINIHEEWKGMTQPVGLVVEPTVLDRLGIFPEKNIKVVSDLQSRLESLFEEEIKGDRIFSAVMNFKDFCKEVLDWQENDLIEPGEFFLNNPGNEIYVALDDYGEVLKPDWIVPDNDEEKNNKVQIIVRELKVGTPFDQIVKDSENKKIWEATPHQRLERLLKDTENPIGILWNGIAIRLVYAPRGESSGHITFPLEPMTSVDGRPMIAALEMLIGPDRLFEGGSKNLRLKKLMEQSRKEQNEVSTRLSEQVLDALWILVRGFDDAEAKAKSIGQSIFNNLSESDPSHIYGGLITVLLRLVFLLYSEDEELMPIDPIYSANYSVTGLAARLRRERSEFQSSMEGRYGAWSSLLSLFRLVFDGGGPYETYLPARHGELFDPDAYPFLEGRALNSSYKDNKNNHLNLINDDVVEKVLNKLLILDGKILSYRALDVEQIGSVYEGIMGFNIEKVKNVSAGILYKPSRQKINISFIFNVEEFLMQSIDKREKWLNDQSGVDLKLSPKIKKHLKHVSNLKELCIALENRLSPYTPRGLNPGNIILQPTAERRRSGSHYTPRTLTEPVVEETFRPWLEKYKFNPSSQEILNLKICDPAMGSGAFLVASCRFLAKYLVMSWDRDGYPPEFDKTFDKDIYARRLISQNCLYGVDKNKFAVSLAKLSLWLVTLSKELPFTFVDHALKCGDSLVGYSLREIQIARKNLQLSWLNSDNQILENLNISRMDDFSADSRDDISYDKKRKLLDKQIEVSNDFRVAGDLMIAAFFAGKNKKDREIKQKDYLALLKNSYENENLIISIKKIREDLTSGEKAITPFHWDLEFPEVFNKQRGGFDAFIGNPPFAGKNTIISANPNGILQWYKNLNDEIHGNADLVAHFFRRSFNLLKLGGSLGLIATNTISQGDTRSSGLRWICMNGGTIFSAKRRYKWPGVASVIVSIVHILKGNYSGNKKLDLRLVKNITAFLFSNGGHEDPKKLNSNAGISFVGSCLLGMGFTFDDKASADDDSPGLPSPLSTMKKLINNNPKNNDVIFPFIGGEEINNSVNHEHDRYVINFGEMDEKVCRFNWPDLMEILEKKVKPERMEQKDKGAKDFWWRFLRVRPELNKAIKDSERILAIALTSNTFGMVWTSLPKVFSHSLGIIALSEDCYFAILQSTFHKVWSIFTGSSMKDDLRYAPSDCFETFPFPNFLVLGKQKQLNDKRKILNSIGKEYYENRLEVMQFRNQGLTTIYNLFNDPKEFDPKILKLRELHIKMDNAVLDAYGWDEIELQYGFGLDYVDLDDDLELPIQLKEFINKGDLFFANAEEARMFESQFLGLSNNRRKLSWRFRWPEAVKEKVLSSLISLNLEYFEDEKVSKTRIKNKAQNLINRSNLILNEDQGQLDIQL